VCIDQTIVPLQIVWDRRDAVLFKVLGSPADNAIDRGQFTSDHVRRQLPRNANRQVVAFFGKLEKAVADGEIDLHVGILGKELGQRGSNVQRGKGNRRRALEHAPRLGMETIDEKRCLLRFLNDTSAVIIKSGADFG
jgi:hypothetical protein